VQTASENKRVIAAFLRELGERGFPLDRPLLVVLDGAKGLRAAVRDVFGDDVAVQRCQWHKRENVVSYLPKQDQPTWRRKLQAAYAHGSYADAKRALERLHRGWTEHITGRRHFDRLTATIVAVDSLWRKLQVTASSVQVRTRILKGQEQVVRTRDKVQEDANAVTTACTKGVTKATGMDASDAARYF
jgi:transposase-like protein